MNAAIQNTISQYFSTFLENASSKFNVPLEQLEELWKETQKEKMKIRPRRRVNHNKTRSAYINFCSHHRKIIKAESPSLTFGEVAKSLGKLWKELDVEEKKKYSDPEYVGGQSKSVPDDAKKVKRARKNKE